MNAGEQRFSEHWLIYRCASRLDDYVAGKTPRTAQHVPSGTISSFHIVANLQVYMAVSKSEHDLTARQSPAKHSCAGCLPKLTEHAVAGETCPMAGACLQVVNKCEYCRMKLHI